MAVDQSPVPLLRFVDSELNNILMWHLSTGRITSVTQSAMVYIEKPQFEVVIKHISLTIVAVCHVLPNHKENKQAYIEAS